MQVWEYLLILGLFEHPGGGLSESVSVCTNVPGILTCMNMCLCLCLWVSVSASIGVGVCLLLAICVCSSVCVCLCAPGQLCV